jgi:hypothetical protein
MATSATDKITGTKVSVSFTPDVLRPDLGANVIVYQPTVAEAISMAQAAETIQVVTGETLSLDVTQSTEIVTAAMPTADTIQPLFTAQSVIAQTQVPESIYVQQAQETIAVDIQLHSHTYGEIPFVYANPINNRAVLDLQRAQAFVVPCASLERWSMLAIEVVNWPKDTLTEVFILLEDVAATTRILWPGFERGVRAPINQGVDNEYRLRSWDGGRSLALERLGAYRSIR